MYVDEFIQNFSNQGMKVITSDLNKYEKDMKEETKNMKHLIEKFKSSITNWFDDDGNPIAKA